MSLVSRHLARHAAAALAGTALSSPAAAAAPVVNPEYAAMLEQLGEDLHRLANTQSVELKVKAKAEMIGRYDDWVLGALVAGEEGKAAQDDVVATMLVWNIDIQNWTMALQIGAHVLSHRLSLPERYKRTPATLIAEEIA
ncbi:MAG: terminase, partial [Sphingopyxis terrae]